MPKFKAFCKRHKCIEEVFQITYLGDNDIKVEAECLGGYVGSDFIIMQSTGLYDSTKFEDLSEEEQKEWLESGKTADEWQGREIFEGDIVEHLDFNSNEISKSEVRILKGCFYLVISVDGFMYDVPMMDLKDDECILQIKGNVHENHELLEVTDD